MAAKWTSVLCVTKGNLWKSAIFILRISEGVIAMTIRKASLTSAFVFLSQIMWKSTFMHFPAIFIEVGCWNYLNVRLEIFSTRLKKNILKCNHFSNRFILWFVSFWIRCFANARSGASPVNELQRLFLPYVVSERRYKHAKQGLVMPFFGPKLKHCMCRISSTGSSISNKCCRSHGVSLKLICNELLVHHCHCHTLICATHTLRDFSMLRCMQAS